MSQKKQQQPSTIAANTPGQKQQQAVKDSVIEETKEQASSTSPNQQNQTHEPTHLEQQPESLHEVDIDSLRVNQDDVSDSESQKCRQPDAQKASQHKGRGNELFREGKCMDAVLQYQQGLKYADDRATRATLFSNMAVCFLKEEDYGYAMKYCRKVLREDENHRKGRINLARCYEQNKKVEEAYEEYKKVELHMEGASQHDAKFVREKIAYLKPKVDEINESRKKEVVEGLKNIGNSFLGYFGMSLDNFKLEQGPGGGYNISFKQ